MSFASTLFLGALSGLTILLGLPLAKFKHLSPRHLFGLHALAIGILFFLFFDVTEHALAPVETAFAANVAARWWLLIVLIVGFFCGILSLTLYEFVASKRRDGASPWMLALFIAAGIGVHNFAEGLAIGTAAMRGSLHFTLLLIIGFGLHNITEAFGIIAPLIGRRVSWRFLLLLGIIGGGPNLLGTMIGFTWRSDALSVFFLGLSSGALLSVIDALLQMDHPSASRTLRSTGLAAGFVLGLLTDIILSALGA